MWEELWTRKRAAVLSVIGVTLFLLVGLVARSFPASERNPPNAARGGAPAATSPASAENAPAPQPAASPTVNVLSLPESAPAPSEEWFVYITGNVSRPGVYRLAAGSRLFHLVEAAGGFSALADPAAVNMAAPLEDSLHVHIPGREERLSGAGQGQTPGTGALATPSAPSSAGGNRASPRASSGIVDINRASEGELVTLRGIGPVMARNIVEHRQRNGPFRRVEDLLQVSGIGPRRLEDLRDFVTVGP